MASTHNTEQCFLVAADPNFRYSHSPHIRDEFGAFIFQVDALHADDLIKLYYTACPDRPFDLAIVPKSELAPTDLVFVKRELESARYAYDDYPSENYEMEDPEYLALGQCFGVLDRLWTDFRKVIEEHQSPPKKALEISSGSNDIAGDTTSNVESPSAENKMVSAPNSYCLVAADERFRFVGVPPFIEGLGAFLFELDEREEAETLANLYHLSESERPFDIKIVAMRELTSTQFVLAGRELDRTRKIAEGEPREDKETPTDVFEALVQTVKSLVYLSLEMKMSQDHSGVPWLPATKTDRELHERFSPSRKASQSPAEAVEQLYYVLERHRLIFLHLMYASRINPLAPKSADSACEVVSPDDVAGYADVYKDTEETGTFLFRHRYRIEEYADRALRRFGSGKGVKIEAEGGTFPFWQLETGAGIFLQDSSELIISTASDVIRLDESKLHQELANDAIEVAFDKGRSRWYSSVWTRWEYLEELEGVIARAKRAVALIPKSDVESITDSTDGEIYYLRLNYVEDEYNWDSHALGKSTSDPNYLRVADENQCFFKMNGRSTAQRLVRLFEKVNKPEKINEHGRVRVSFSYHAASDFDEDDRFLLEDELKKIYAKVLKGEINPAYPLSCEYLCDQAQRWVESFQPESATDTSDSGQVVENSSDNESEAEHEPASEETLRAFLPTAIIGAMTLRDLFSVCRCFPGAIPKDEANSVDRQLRNEILETVKHCNFEDVLDSVRTTLEQDVDPELMATALMTTLIMHHPDHGETDGSSDEIQMAMKRVIDVSVKKVLEPVRSLAERVQRAMIFDCRIPTPEGDESFREPQRFLQMLDVYWKLLRNIVSLHIDLPAGLNPNPLANFIVNLKSRIDSCLEVLVDCDGAAESKEAYETLVEIILTGDIDDLQAVPEWSNGELSKVDRFVVKTRLKLGAKSYVLTAAERTFVDVVECASREYEKKVKSSWKHLLEGAESAKQEEPRQPQELSSDEGELKPFTGGTMVFYDDRVELCGVEICDGSRRLSRRRKALDLLRAMQSNGKFVCLSCEQLAGEIGIEESAVPGLISHTRNRIVELLQRDARLSSSKEDVILTTEKHGYCLSHKLTVEVDNECLRNAKSDQSGDDRVDGEVSDVRNRVVPDVPNVPNDQPTSRQEWILQQIDKERKIKRPDVARQFDCDPRTAQRDLNALMDAGKIEYFGSKRSGYYRRPPTQGE